ncbi:undecaprenyl-diphosphate phosphatase [Halocalculus aciditolerans]|uniref:Undecaprenyl-diphosphatase n=1 Tax=Halocalculus aciditolerans TaxID=1383812 RepID=A0A830FPP1_9EURY|nr:undecaprenyl-diphosphate phosphatase [Halocalculus aciditolerans]GGL68106.1 undecaprenyl-diphosphatase [Halocalculus aciditolerans]
MELSVVVAFVLGVLQGVLEWLPVSSEGNVSLVLTLLGEDPVVATKLALFLHLGTGIAALAYYRDDVRDLLYDVPEWRPSTWFDAESADLSFIVLATLASGIVGVVVYGALEAVVTGTTTNGFVVIVAVLLLLTGLLQKFAAGFMAERETPTALDAVLVGAGQGLALLPGVSRSGTTVSILLLRGYDENAALRLSFVLAIPASVAAAGLTLVTDGLIVAGVLPTLVMVAAAATVGYLTIDALTRLVDRVAFWLVCVAFALLMLAGVFFLSG